jgi:hypothetical protein
MASDHLRPVCYSAHIAPERFCEEKYLWRVKAPRQMQGWCLAFIPFEKRVVGPNGEIGSHSRVARPLVYAHDACKADKTPPTSVNCGRARRHTESKNRVRHRTKPLIIERAGIALDDIAKCCANGRMIRRFEGNEIGVSHGDLRVLT